MEVASIVLSVSSCTSNGLQQSLRVAPFGTAYVLKLQSQAQKCFLTSSQCNVASIGMQQLQDPLNQCCVSFSNQHSHTNSYCKSIQQLAAFLYTGKCTQLSIVIISYNTTKTVNRKKALQLRLRRYQYIQLQSSFTNSQATIIHSGI